MNRQRFELEPLEQRLLLSGEAVVEPLLEGLQELPSLVEQLEISSAHLDRDIPVLQEALDANQAIHAQLTDLFERLEIPVDATTQSIEEALNQLPSTEATLVEDTPERLAYDLLLSGETVSNVALGITPDKTGELRLGLDGEVVLLTSWEADLRVGLELSPKENIFFLDPFFSEIYVNFDVEQNLDATLVLGDSGAERARRSVLC